MKIGGRTFDAPKTQLLVLPRQDGDIPLTFTAVNDDSEFERMFPRPVAPRVFKQKLGQTINDVNDVHFVAKLDTWAAAKTNWMFLKSIEPSKIEWDTVNMSDPATFGNWKEDLLASGFSTGERNAIFNAYVECNMLTDEMIVAARASFLASQAAQAAAEAESSQNTAPTATQSGSPANGLEFARPA